MVPPAVEDLELAITPVSGFPVVLNADGSRFKDLSGLCSGCDCAAIPPCYPSDPIMAGVTGQGAVGDLNGDGQPICMQPMAGGLSLQAAPGDNGVGNGPVARCEIYTSGKAIKLSNLERAKRVKAPRPASPKRNQSFKIRLTGKKRVYVAVRSRDRAGCWSPLSRTALRH